MPKTHNNIFKKIYQFENLYNAYLKARQNKRYHSDVLAFSANLEENIISLQNELMWHMYKTGLYRRFYIHDPKTRLVAALPFRDRVLQHALNTVIEPLFERKFIYDSYACRARKGTHAGADRVTNFLRRRQRECDKVHCLKCDIAKYFPSIRQDILMRILKRTIACEDTLWLIQEILSSWPDYEQNNIKGIPIGNPSSQLFANVYLDQLDHFVKEILQEKYYVRYMDDFVILSAKKQHLWRIKGEIERFLEEKLDLQLNHKTGIWPVSQGIDFLGYRIWSTHRKLRKSSVKRMKRRFKVFRKKLVAGRISEEKVNASIQSWLGHASHCDSYNLRKKLFKSTDV